MTLPVPVLHAIHRYPVKSMRGQSLDAASIEARGLAGDRRWMMIDAESRFVTARQYPQLLGFSAELIADGLVVFAPDGNVRAIAEPAASEPLIEVGIWKSTCPARLADPASNAWLSKLLGLPVRLVHMADDCIREVSPEWAEPGDIVSFADGFPLLVIGTASLELLNSKLSRPVAMANFRPSIVVKTTIPHIEDRWKRIALGAVELSVVKPCTRCVMTTVDPDSVEKAADGEPLATLKTYRREAIGVTFGQNLIPRSFGPISIGMDVRVLE